MSIKKNKKYVFENDLLQFESLDKNYTNKIFEEFNETSKKLNLSSKINNLMSGKIINHSENQAATHTIIRGLNLRHTIENGLYNFNIKINSEFRSNWLKRLLLPTEQVDIVTLGIGGSFEGPKLLTEFLEQKKGTRFASIANYVKYHFITGSDSSEFLLKLSKLNPKKTFFVVFSKSFRTDETIEIFKRAMQWSKDNSKFLFITSNPDEVKKYECFGKKFTDESIISFDKTIGGRHSIWVDTIPSLYGDIKFLNGGNFADKQLKDNQEYLNFLKLLSFTDIWNHNVNGKYARVILSYVWRLRSLPNYIQQLEMESLGKAPNSDSKFQKTGQLIFGGYGPTAQHSYFQLLHQGTHQICADIIASNEDHESLAYAQAITQSSLLANGEGDIKLDNESKINGNIPVNLFILRKLDSFTLGYLIASWEHRTFITAMMLGINPFDQFGVNAGKIYTNKYLAEYD